MLSLGKLLLTEHLTAKENSFLDKRIFVVRSSLLRQSLLYSASDGLKFLPEKGLSLLGVFHTYFLCFL